MPVEALSRTTRPQNATPSTPDSSSTHRTNQSAQTLAGQHASPAQAPLALTRDDMNRLATLGILLSGVSNPLAMISGMQGKLRNAGTQQSTSEINASDAVRSGAEAARTESLEKSIAAAEKALSGMPKWLKKVIGVVLSVVGAVASTVTGGASVALTVVGVILLVGARVVEGLTDLGVIPEKYGYAIAAGIRIAASVVMSFGSGAAAEVPNLTATVAGTVADIASQVQATVDTINSGIDVHNAIRMNQSTNHRLDAAEFANQGDAALESMEEAAEHLKAIIRDHTRAAGRIHSLLQLQGQAGMTAARIPA